MVFLIYTVAICTSYVILSAISLIEIRKYVRSNAYVDYRKILSSPFAPSISLVAPAYNEGLTIVDNVKSLLSIEYNNYDVIIVNDGSKDDSIKKLVEAFNLVKVDFFVPEVIRFQKVKAVYKSTDRALKRLVVVDKENGGKADALNAGICVSDKELVACIDVDCIIQPDALLKMVKPYLEDRENIVAIGGVVRIANSCEIEEGRLVKINMPEGFWARFQVLEYMRAFLLGRMAWSRINGLMLISGAFGLFKRNAVIDVGGYDHTTVGEDMELVVRIRRKLIEEKRKARVIYIPDPLCWTEAPSTTNILSRQRNRWARGTIETLGTHSKLFFNPRYGILGMVSFPYWFFFEFLAPWVEVTGLAFFAVLTAMQLVDWQFTGMLLLMMYLFSLFMSLLTLVAEEISYYKYDNKGDFFAMLGTAMVEPIVFHPLVLIWALRGNFDKIKGKKSWGEMTRTGFIKKPSTGATS